MQNIGKLSGKLWKHFCPNMKTFQKVLHQDNLQCWHHYKVGTIVKVGYGQTILTQSAHGTQPTKTFYWKFS